MREAEKKRLVKLIEEAHNKSAEAIHEHIMDTLKTKGRFNSKTDGDRQRIYEIEADYLLDKGVIVPPCKVGDEVYCIVFLPVEGRLEIGMGSVISMEIRHEKLNIRIADCEPTRYANLDITVDSRDFGKTVFFSEAEAKYALKNRRSVSLVNGHIEE